MHVYVHVPFCARRCSYCDFAIAVRRSVPDEAFVDCIVREWHERLEAIPTDAVLDTVYFGGGTPSRLEPASIARMLDAFSGRRHMAPDVEITLEANPDDVDGARAHGWRAAGINRVSLGVQSHDPGVLAWMHRTHAAAQVAPAVARLRDVGIDNISLDLIFALPPHLQRDWQRDLDETLALHPDHVSLYGLTVEPHTPLSRWTARDALALATDDSYAADYLAAHRTITGAGYEHYEVSNASRPGRRSRHNGAYWSGADYLGLGPSAHSLLGRTRRWNVRDWTAYRRASEEGGVLEAGHEHVADASLRLEQCYLGLRTDTGVPSRALPAAIVRDWCAAGWARSAGGVVRLTAEGWLRLDALVIAATES